ncbi:MAG: ribonuclease P protein component [Alphaproteobacteria bacterium]|nr:ribonuclease P protein component [Alphaproteobacteria bacterium]
MKVLILKKRKDFLKAAKGVKSVMPSLILQAAPFLAKPNKTECDSFCRLGYTATKKLGKAHIRNRTKRRMRAAAAQILPLVALPNIDYVLIGRYNTANVKFEKLIEDLKNAILEVNKSFSSVENVKSNEKTYDISD